MMRSLDWAPDRWQSGHEVGIEPATTQRVVVSTDDLAGHLRRVIRRGLPADRRSIGEVLPHLRNVVARATHPDDLLSRIDAANDLIVRMVEEVDDAGTFGRAVGVLFGTAEGTRQTTLTVRRQHCAALLDYDFDHFRKRVERRMLDVVAEALHRDLISYRSRVRRATTAVEVARPTPTLTPAELTREDELLSRIWQHLYELRAERIALALAGDPDDRRHHEDQVERVAKHLRELTDRYVETYGRQLIPNGQLDYNIDGLEKLVVWRVGEA
jgi:hypothetical protein